MYMYVYLPAKPVAHECLYTCKMIMGPTVHVSSSMKAAPERGSDGVRHGTLLATAEHLGESLARDVACTIHIKGCEGLLHPLAPMLALLQLLPLQHGRQPLIILDVPAKDISRNALASCLKLKLVQSKVACGGAPFRCERTSPQETKAAKTNI
jgi:hypothetical protein